MIWKLCLNIFIPTMTHGLILPEVFTTGSARDENYSHGPTSKCSLSKMHNVNSGSP